VMTNLAHKLFIHSAESRQKRELYPLRNLIPQDGFGQLQHVGPQHDLAEAFPETPEPAFSETGFTARINALINFSST